MENKIKMVVGNWGDYNACNCRALGSKWLDLSEFETVEDLKNELEKEGFDVENGEFFIQDIEGLAVSNCDYTNPFQFFALIKESGLLDDDYKLKTAIAYIETFGYDFFIEKVDNEGSYWDNDINLYADQSLEDVAYELVEDCYFTDDTPQIFKDFFDYKSFANSLTFDGYYETSIGVLYVG